MYRKAGKHRIYMNVGYVLSEEQLRGYFARYGTVLDVYLPKHKSGRNKGFGFTTFEAAHEVDAVLQHEEHVIEGMVVKINRAGPRPEYTDASGAADQAAAEAGGLGACSAGGAALPVTPRTGGAGPGAGGVGGAGGGAAPHGQGPRLYVGGIPDEVTEAEITAHFSRWGEVIDIYFPGKKGARRVNYCFVTFENWRAAQRAANQSERNINGKVLQSISIAEDRTEQRADVGQSAAERAQRSGAMGAHTLPTLAAPPGTFFPAAAAYGPLAGVVPAVPLAAGGYAPPAVQGMAGQGLAGLTPLQAAAAAAAAVPHDPNPDVLPADLQAQAALAGADGETAGLSAPSAVPGPLPPAQLNTAALIAALNAAAYPTQPQPALYDHLAPALRAGQQMPGSELCFPGSLDVPAGPRPLMAFGKRSDLVFGPNTTPAAGAHVFPEETASPRRRSRDVRWLLAQQGALALEGPGAGASLQGPPGAPWLRGGPMADECGRPWSIKAGPGLYETSPFVPCARPEPNLCEAGGFAPSVKPEPSLYNTGGGPGGWGAPEELAERNDSNSSSDSQLSRLMFLGASPRLPASPLAPPPLGGQSFPHLYQGGGDGRGWAHHGPHRRSGLGDFTSRSYRPY